jgi:hypothetical protein
LTFKEESREDADATTWDYENRELQTPIYVAHTSQMGGGFTYILSPGIISGERNIGPDKSNDV